MKRICRKLRSARGETLVETMAAVLVVALACIIFATMTMTASHLNAAAIAADETFYTELSAAETQAGSTSGTVTVSWSGGSQDFDVTVAGSGSELRSYTYAGGGG